MKSGEGLLDGFHSLAKLLSDDPLCLWLYENMNERMDATVELFDKRRRAFHLDRYEFAANFVEGGTVADIACGTGYGAEILKKEGRAAKVFGVDIDAKAVEYARRLHSSTDVEYFCASGDSTPLASGSVDAVVSFETLEHVPSDLALLEEFHRVLSSHGLLICSVPNNWPLHGTPFHVRVYDRQRLESTLSNCFHTIALYNQNSGCDSEFNRGQPRGIRSTEDDNEENAECFIAVCVKRD